MNSRKYGYIMACVLACTGTPAVATDFASDVEAYMRPFNMRLNEATSALETADILHELKAGLMNDMDLSAEATAQLTDEALYYYRQQEVALADVLNPLMNLAYFQEMSNEECTAHFLSYFDIFLPADAELARYWKIADIYKKVGALYDLDGRDYESARYYNLAADLIDDYFITTARVLVRGIPAYSKESMLKAELTSCAEFLKKSRTYSNSQYPLKAFALDNMTSGRDLSALIYAGLILTDLEPVNNDDLVAHGYDALLKGTCYPGLSEGLLKKCYLKTARKLVMDMPDFSTEDTARQHLSMCVAMLLKADPTGLGQSPLLDWVLDSVMAKDVALAVRTLEWLFFTDMEPISAHDLFQASYLAILNDDVGSADIFLETGKELIEGGDPLFDRETIEWKARFANYVAIQTLETMKSDPELSGENNGLLLDLEDVLLTDRGRTDDDLLTIFGMVPVHYMEDAYALYSKIQDLHRVNMSAWKK
jgi:hypothetical protein